MQYTRSLCIAYLKCSNLVWRTIHLVFLLKVYLKENKLQVKYFLLRVNIEEIIKVGAKNVLFIS